MRGIRNHGRASYRFLFPMVFGPEHIEQPLAH